MIDPTTPKPDAFLPVQVVCGVYVLLVLGITAGLVRLGVPVEMGVYVFLAVGAVLSIPIIPLVRRVHPNHRERQIFLMY